MTETIIAAGRLVTARPTGGEPTTLPTPAVLVRDTRIVGMGTVEEMRRLAAGTAQLLQFPPTSTLLPGLINAHVRLVLNGGPTPYTDFPDTTSGAAALPVQMAHRAQQALAAGVTTLRDLGDVEGLAIELGRQTAAGAVPGPRIVAAGPPLTTPDGDAAFLGGEVDGDPGIRAAIATRAASGAALICYHDSGSHLPGRPEFWDTQFSAAQCALIVAEAAAHGLPVAAHVHSAVGIAHAAAARVRSIEHCTWSVGPEQFQRDEHTATTIADNGIFVCIPSGSNRAAVIAKYGEDTARSRWYDRYRWLDQLGVALIPGTTAGSTNAPFDDYVSGLETYEWLGFSRARILQLATTTAAAALGLGATTGVLAPGYSADLIVVEGNPLDDLQALRRVQLVLADGRRAPATTPDPG